MRYGGDRKTCARPQHPDHRRRARNCHAADGALSSDRGSSDRAGLFRPGRRLPAAAQSRCRVVDRFSPRRFAREFRRDRTHHGRRRSRPSSNFRWPTKAAGRTMACIAPASDCLVRALRIPSMEGSVRFTGVSLSSSTGMRRRMGASFRLRSTMWRLLFRPLGRASVMRRRKCSSSRRRMAET